MDLQSIVIANRYKILEQKILDTLCLGKLCDVYDALDQDNKPVTVKVLSENAKQSSLERLLRFKREVERVSKATHENILKIYEYGEYDGQSYFVTEHVNGAQPVTDYLKQSREIDKVANIILQICSGLAIAHEKGIIHQFINPSSILIFQNGKGPTAKLSDFGIGLLLDLAGIKEENEIVRTFGYMSPEATGILRKPIDERSDLYSLGIIFYQLVTGRLPYDGRDTSTLIHQHIAQMPPAPMKLNPSIAPVVSKIILRLIAKDPLDRYQTVSGLIADLKEYLREKAEGIEVPFFEIARSDRAAQLSFATRLIGRDKEISALQKLIAQTKQGKGGFALVYGSPGVGKSRLVDDLRGYIHSIGGIFVGGKCYQYESTTPFNVFSEALDAYVRKLKRIGKEEQTAAINRMQAPLGELGGEVVKIAPTIEDLIGKQPELETMDDAEKERYRFMITVKNFFLSLGSVQNPFILFLDDLQWADEGSIELLGWIAESVMSQPMVVIASYRDTDVDKHHPWIRAVDTMKEKNIPITEILVKPFDIKGTSRIASEILMEEEDAVLPLTMELHGRTEGNAFFVIEMLRALVDQEIIFFKDNQYQYDLGKFRGATLPTNVVDVVLRRIDYISEENQKILAYASLMGREIEFERISDLTEIQRETVIDAIEDGIKNQLLTRDITGKENVVFMHDRIREALYRKVSEEERIELHRQIAHLLEEQHKDDLEPVLFELAHHFSQAGIEDKTLRYSLEAGKKAQSSYANDQAIRLYEAAKGIFDKQGKSSTTEYLDTLENLGAVYYQAGRFDEALETLRSCESLIPKENKLGKAQVLSKIGDTLQKKGELQHCEQVLVEALKLLGVRLPNNIITVLLGNVKQFFVHGLQSLFPNLFVRKEYSKVPEADVIAYLLHRLFYYYYFTDLIKGIYVQFKAQNMSERMLGPGRMLSKIYAITGMAWMQVGWPWWARRHIRLAEKIAEDLNDKAYIGLASAFHGWVEHPYRSSESVQFAKKAVDLLKSVGEYWDLGHAGCCMYWGKQKAGGNFDELIQGNKEQIAIMESINALQNLGWALGVEGMFVTFIGGERLKNEGISTLEESARLLEQVNDKAWLLCAHGYLAYAHLRLGNYDKAIPYAERVSKRFWSDHILTTWLLDILGMCAQVYLYTLMNKPDLTEDERKKYLKAARRFCRIARFKGWIYPNYRGWAYLVNGTFQWITGKKQQAIKTWDQGIAHLRAHGNDIYRLASILLEEASFLIKDAPNDEKAKKYLFEAKDLFTKLGATFDLQRTNKLLKAISPEEEVVETREALTITRHLDSLLSVTQAIGSIFILQDLLDKIVDQAMKVTGAERGFLLLYDEQDRTLKQKVSQGIGEQLAGLPFSYESYKLSLNMIQEVEKSGKGLFAGEDSTAHPPVSEELKEYKVKEAMCVPLKTKNKPIGMIYLDNHLAGGTFGEDELELMKSFAVQASISIENSYLVSNLVEQERLKQEMELGRQIQLSLLPEEKPQVKEFEIEGSMQPAKEIGGDYFDYISFAGDPDRMGIVVADVTGKGVDAGMVMGMTKSTIHTLSEQDLTTRDLVLRLNRHLCKLLKKQKFISLVYAEYSAKEGIFTWSGAGHEHIIVVRNGQKGEPEVEVIVTGGVVLGVFEDIEEDISQKSISLNKGDKVILYTAGVTEARNADNMFFTLDRLLEVIKHAPSLSAQDLLSHINEKIQQFIGAASQYDDITLVVMVKE